MTAPTEVYVLCKQRSLSIAQYFLNKVVPNRKATQDEYSVPECSDRPLQCFREADDVLSHLIRNNTEPYGLYWNNTGSDTPLQAFLFFTTDGAMIAGLAVNGDGLHALATLSRVVEGKFGYITLEDRPPDTASEFVRRCQDIPQHASGLKLLPGHELSRSTIAIPLGDTAESVLCVGGPRDTVEVLALQLPDDPMLRTSIHGIRLFQEINRACGSMIDDYESEQIDVAKLPEMLATVASLKANWDWEPKLGSFLRDLEALVQEAMRQSRPLLFDF